MAYQVLPDDLTGKTLLNLGARDDFLCTEAIKRGASRAISIGCDAKPLPTGCTTKVDVSAGNGRCRQVELDTYEFQETFDYVLCLNILHELSNPVATLDRMARACRERLILELPVIGPRTRKQLGLSRLQAMVFKSLPAMYAHPLPRSRGRNWYITPAAMTTLLQTQLPQFPRVEIFGSPDGERYVAVAHRRRIGRLVLIAGATSAGKSTLIENLCAQRAPGVAEKLSLGEIGSWRAKGVRQIARSKKLQFDRLLLHYDFLGRIEWNRDGYHNTAVDDVLQTADHVTTATIWRSPEQLLRQYEENEIHAYVRKNGVKPTREKHLQLHQDYQHCDRVRAYYANWFAFVSTLRGEHIVVDMTDGTRFLSIADWQREHGMCGTEAKGRSDDARH